MTRICSLFAQDEQGGFGHCGTLPWPRCAPDMRHFVQLTSTTDDRLKRNAVLMGRRTCDSLKGPLKGRVNIVITSTRPELTIGTDVLFFSSVTEALDTLANDFWSSRIETIFAIGGIRILKHCIPLSSVVFRTIVRGRYEADVRMTDDWTDSFVKF